MVYVWLAAPPPPPPPANEPLPVFFLADLQSYARPSEEGKKERERREREAQIHINPSGLLEFALVSFMWK